MKNIYFIGAPTQAKGITDFNFLANYFSEYNFYWFTFRVDKHIEKSFPKITFITGLEDLTLKEKIQNKMDIFISCSRFEGFCLPIAEALMMNKQVISYKLEEVESEFGKFINYVSCFDKNEFIEKIIQISQQSSSVKQKGLAQKFIESNYSPEIVTDKLLKIFSK